MPAQTLCPMPPPPHVVPSPPSNQAVIKGALAGKASDNVRGKIDGMLQALHEKAPRVQAQVRRVHGHLHDLGKGQSFGTAAHLPAWGCWFCMSGRQPRLPCAPCRCLLPRRRMTSASPAP